MNSLMVFNSFTKPSAWSFIQHWIFFNDSLFLLGLSRGSSAVRWCRRWLYASWQDFLSISDCPHLSVLLCEQVVLVPALVAGGGGMEGSGGLRCLKSRKTKVNPALNTLVKPLSLFFLLFPIFWGWFLLWQVFFIGSGNFLARSLNWIRTRLLWIAPSRSVVECLCSSVR